MEMPPAPWPTATDDLDRWASLVAQHPIWERVTDPGRDTLRVQAAELAVHLAWTRRDGLFRLADDPWQDLEFAGRMLRRVAGLVAGLPAEVRLSGAEAALLVTVPLLYDTLWATRAGLERSVRPHDLTPSQDASSDRAAFERFAQSYAQPYRRAVAAVARANAAAGAAGGGNAPADARDSVGSQRDAAEEIGWWLLHRWIGRQPAAYRPESLVDLLAPVGGSPAFAAERVSELLWALRADPGFLGRTDRTGSLAAVGPDGVRERFIGYVLVAARALAIEAVALPEVIGEHLGIVDPVSAAALHECVRSVVWRVRGTALVLDAVCGHPAVEVALRTHIDALNLILTEIQRAAAAGASAGEGVGDGAPLSELRHVPTHVTTDGLRPTEVDGVRAYQSAGVRFRLAEDRVQELLMGEQLYGDPALAVRELYQNALDACRYREARTEYLNRTRGLGGGWTGRIRFEHGTGADGRPYLDCVDNGIGMGVRELSEVFAQAGVRLGDLPEFLEEQSEWARLDPPVQLFPNSRFGIGVLSYFMLADEITVDTCRLGRDGAPGQRLRVSIAGPGSLFRIQELGPGTESGTTVRLHLRTTTVSCVETLRSVLWVADFHTEAVDGAERQVWQPGELSEAAGPNRAAAKTAGGAPPVVADPAAGVWWCHGEGGILADGLWAGQDLTGAVVNLSRDLAPRLSVDRTKVLAYREEDLERLLWQAVPALVEAGSAVLTFSWLYTFAFYRPLIADVIFERALASGYTRWELGGDTIDATISGCFGPDGGTLIGPDQLIEWRLTALAAAGRLAKVITPAPDWAQAVRARPSDALLLSFDIDGSAPWLDPVDTVPLSHLVRAARRIGRSASEIATRMEELGYGTAVGHETVGTDPDDLVLLSRDLDGSRPWLDPANPVVLPHLLKGAQRTSRPVREVMARLARVGLQIDADISVLALDQLDPADLILASRDLDGAFPWLDQTEPVPLMHVIRVAHRLSRDAADVAARLAVLGYPLAPECAGVRTEPDDLVLVSRDLDSASPWLDPAETVSAVHVLRAAEKTSRSPRQVYDRLTSFGFRVVTDPDALLGLVLTQDDLTIVSRDLDGSYPWLDAVQPVSTLHLLRAAEVTGRNVGEIARRLSTLGHRVDVNPDEIIVDHLDPDDATMTSVDLDGAHPWLDVTQPVPAVHLLRAARVTGRDLHDVAARLTVFGYTVRTDFGELTVDQLTRDDLVMTSRDLDGSDPWIPPGERILLPHVLQAARRTRRPAADIVVRLRQLGYPVEVDLSAIPTDKIRSSDLVFASNDLDGTRPWLDPDHPVALSHVLAAAHKTHQTVADVARRLQALGYHTPDLDVRLPRPQPGGV
jgi:hypothetical protein